MGHGGLDKREKGFVVRADYGGVLRNSASRGEKKCQSGQGELGMIDEKPRGWVGGAEDFAELATEIRGIPTDSQDGGFDGGRAGQPAFFQKSRLAFEIPSAGMVHRNKSNVAMSVSEKTPDGMSTDGAVVEVKGRKRDLRISGAHNEGGNFLCSEPSLNTFGNRKKNPTSCLMFLSGPASQETICGRSFERGMPSDFGFSLCFPQTFGDRIEEVAVRGGRECLIGSDQKVDFGFRSSRLDHGRGTQNLAAVTRMIGDNSRLLQPAKGKAKDRSADIEVIGEDSFARQSVWPLARENGVPQPYGGLLSQGTSRDRTNHVEESHRMNDCASSQSGK